MSNTTGSSRMATYEDLLGLGAIGARLYVVEDLWAPGSIAAAERRVWAKLFWPLWERLHEQWRDRIREELSFVRDDLDRAVADAERLSAEATVERGSVAATRGATPSGGRAHA